MKRILILIFFLAFVILAISPVHAQQNVSCNDSYYHKQNYVDIKMPASGPVGSKPIVNWWVKSSGWGLRAIVYRNGTRIDTVDIPSGAVNNINKKWDSREVEYGDTIRYEIKILSDLSVVPAWMPSNVGQYSGYCGTGCLGVNGNYYAVPNLNSLYTSAISDNATPYNLNNTPYSLFLPAQRTNNSVDTSLTCWNDVAGDGGQDADYNDFFMMWTTDATIPPVTSPPVTTTEPPITTTEPPVTTTEPPPNTITCREEFSDSFNDGVINTFWTKNIEAGSTITETEGKIQVTIPDSSGNVLANLTSNENELQGDFIAEVELSANATADWGEGALAFSVYDGTTLIDRARISLYTTDTGKQITTEFYDGAITETHEVSAETQVVYAKIQRVGSKISMYYKADADSEYILSQSTVNGFTTPGRFELYTMSLGNSYPEVHTTFDNFAITCPAAAPTPSVTHTPGETGIAEDMMIIAGAIFYVVGVLSFMGAKAINKRQQNIEKEASFRN